MLHNCNCCEYNTSRIDNYNRHLESKKHKSKIELYKKEEEIIKKDEIIVKKNEIIVKKEEENNNNLLFVSDKITKLEDTLVKEAYNNKKSLENKIKNEATKNNKIMIEKIEEVKKIATKNREYAKSTLTILNELYKDNPPLEYPGDLKSLTALYKHYNLTKTQVMKTNKLQKLIIKDFVNKTLVDSIIKILTQFLKKDNLHLQSVFNTDSARNKYATKCADSWEKDLNGLYLNTTVIKPFCLIIKTLMHNYLKYKFERSKDYKKKLYKDGNSDSDVFLNNNSEPEFLYKDDSSDDNKRGMEELDEFCNIKKLIRYIEIDQLYDEIIAKLSPILNYGVKIKKC